MRLFDDLVRTDQTAKTYTESTYAYYNRSARPGVAAMRDLLEQWFAIFPITGQGHIRGHFRSPIENQHQAAFFELYLHELLVRLGFAVELHPPAESVATHPDYLASRNGKPAFYVEATLAGVPSAAAQAAGSRTAVVYDAINTMDSPNFFIGVEVRGAPATPPPARRMRNDVAAWLSTLDLDLVRALDDDRNEVPTLRWTHDGWSVVFRPIPKGPKFRAKPGVRPIGVHMSEPGWLNTQGDIKDAIEKKSSRYGNLGLPYLIALNVLSLHCDRTDVLNVLFGDETTLVSEKPDGTLAVEAGERRRNGALFGPTGPRRQIVSAVLVVSNLNPWSMGVDTPRLYHNPWAQNVLSSSHWDLPQYVPDHPNHCMTLKAGRSAAEVLGLPMPWPIPDAED